MPLDDFPPEEQQARLDDYDAQVVEKIVKHHVFLQGVFPGEGDEPGPLWIYTVGLFLYHHPELVVFGLSQEAGHFYLNHMAIDHVYDKREVFAPGRLSGFFNDGAMDGWLLEVENSDNEQYPFSMANRLARGLDYPTQPVPALQLVYPDRAGRFPWEDGYDLDPRLQPLLGTAP